MSAPPAVTGAIYRAASLLVSIASPWLPGAMHPGKRARSAVASLESGVADKRFARAVLESSCKCSVIQWHVSRLHGTPLRTFLTHHVEYDGAVTPAELASDTRPIIFATPHYGEPMVGAIALTHLLSGRKTVDVFYDRHRYGAQLQTVLERAGIPASRQLCGLAGVRAALRALENGNCLALLPDAFHDLSQTVVVPFFGRLLRVASGTASLALRSTALIVPAFSRPAARLGLRITFCEPIDPARVAADDESQAIFTLMHLLFSRIESQLRADPCHWRYWEMLPHVSTPLGTGVPLDNLQILRALKAKFRALPPAVQDIPELELLLE
jgi:lauroyl/myristoyl acyltransferase